MAYTIAAQMYTLRDYLNTEAQMKSSLEKLVGYGYSAVQLSAVGAMNGDRPEVSAQLAKKMLDDNGMKCIATHRDWKNLLNFTEREIEFQKTLGCDYAAIGGIPDEFRKKGANGYRQWIDEAAPVIETLRTSGIQFAYHNHSHEFERFGDGKQQFFDLLIEEASKDLMLEVDLYWVAHAGVNPIKLLKRITGRVPVVHIKDKAIIDGQVAMAPIGEGNLDWNEFLPALETAGSKWICVEQDQCLRDPFDCMKSSYDYLTRASTL
jgi:sugar phosphate isomerase/epimerase